MFWIAFRRLKSLLDNKPTRLETDLSEIDIIGKTYVINYFIQINLILVLNSVKMKFKKK